MKDANNHLDELKRKLNQAQNRITIVTADAGALNNDFSDLEKNQSQDGLLEDLSGHTDQHSTETERKNGFKKDLDGIQARITALDDPSTTADQWLEITADCNKIDEQIVAAIGDATTLISGVDETGEAATELKSKYAKKQATHKECDTEKEARQGEINKLKDQLGAMADRLAHSRQDLRDLNVSEASGQAALDKNNELMDRFAGIGEKQGEMKDRLNGFQDRLNEITADLPKLPEKVVTQEDLDETLEN